MSNLHNFVRSQLKAILSATTIEQVQSALSLQNNAQEILNIPLTLITAWPHESDFPESGYDNYVYCHVKTRSGDSIVRVGGNAGRQALYLEEKNLLPSKRTLTQVDKIYFWKRNAS